MKKWQNSLLTILFAIVVIGSSIVGTSKLADAQTANGSDNKQSVEQRSQDEKIPFQF